MEIYSLNKLVENNLNKTIKISGIYVWGVKIDSQYVPLYVGKAKKIPQRIYEHLCAWRGGAYQIPKWDDIVQGKKEWEIIHMPNGFMDFKVLMDKKEGQETITNVSLNPQERIEMKPSKHC